MPILNLPTDYSRPLKQHFAGDIVSFSLNKWEVQEIRKISKETGTTVFMIMLSFWTILLSKLSGLEDIIIGTPVAGRGHPDIENIIGMFVNTLPLRNSINNETSVKEFISQVKAKVLRAFENQEFQYEEIIETIKGKRDISRNPLFDVMFVLQNIKNDGGMFPKSNKEISFSFNPLSSATKKNPLSPLGGDNGFNIFRCWLLQAIIAPVSSSWIRTPTTRIRIRPIMLIRAK